MDKHFKDFKSERGNIFVNKYYQVTNVNPLTGSISGDEKVLDNIFCFGDACLTKLNEPKNIPAVVGGALITSNNLIKSVEGKLEEFKEMPEHNFFISGVYFDDKLGGTAMGDQVTMNENQYKDKEGYEPPFFTFLKNNPDGQKNYNGYIQMFMQ